MLALRRPIDTGSVEVSLGPISLGRIRTVSFGAVSSFRRSSNAMCHDSASPFQLKIHGPDETYFWRTHQGAELDLMVVKGGKRIGIEIKRMDAPTLTPSMRIALSDLDLERLIVIYPGSRAYDLGPKVRVLPFVQLLQSKWLPPRSR